jgi:hypothetical protein
MADGRIYDYAWPQHIHTDPLFDKYCRAVLLSVTGATYCTRTAWIIQVATITSLGKGLAEMMQVVFN